MNASDFEFSNLSAWCVESNLKLKLMDNTVTSDFWSYQSIVFPKLQDTADRRLSLPADLRQMDIGYAQFNQLLKTCLFGHWDCAAL